LPAVYCRNRLRLFDQAAYRSWHLFVARSATQWPHLSLTGQAFATRERSAGTGVLCVGRELRMEFATWQQQYMADRSAYKKLARSQHGRISAESQSEKR